MNSKQKTRLMPWMMASAVCFIQLPLAAYADTSQQLMPETPIADSEHPQPQTPAPTQLLNGSVHKNERTLAPDGSAPAVDPTLNGQASDASGNLQSETAAKGTPTPYDLAVQKLAAKLPLTAEEYRSLNVGVVGFDSARTYFTSEFKVDKVLRGSPAALAGIKVGDTFAAKNPDDSNVQDPTVPSYVFSCGIAGQTKDYTLQRHGKPLHFHIVEMNMEDLPDPKDRRMEEELVRQTGWPVQNVPVNAPANLQVNTPTITAKSIIRGLLGF